jgi:hypothetical protein
VRRWHGHRLVGIDSSLIHLPNIRIGLLRADSGFADESFFGTAQEAGLAFIVVAPLTRPIQRLCRHADGRDGPAQGRRGLSPITDFPLCQCRAEGENRDRLFDPGLRTARVCRVA